MVINGDALDEDILKEAEKGTDEGYLGFILPKTKAIDIDNEEDWKFAEAIFSSRNIK